MIDTDLLLERHLKDSCWHGYYNLEEGQGGREMESLDNGF
jgi:hypothetical protein